VSFNSPRAVTAIIVFAKQFGAIPTGPTVRCTAVILPPRASAEGGIFSVACSRKQEEIENLLLLPPASRK